MNLATRISSDITIHLQTTLSFIIHSSLYIYWNFSFTKKAKYTNLHDEHVDRYTYVRTYIRAYIYLRVTNWNKRYAAGSLSLSGFVAFFIQLSAG